MSQFNSVQFSFNYVAPNSVILRHFKDKGQLKPIRIQLIQIQSSSNQIKWNKFQIFPIHTETVKKKNSRGKETNRLHRNCSLILLLILSMYKATMEKTF